MGNEVSVNENEKKITCRYIDVCLRKFREIKNKNELHPKDHKVIMKGDISSSKMHYALHSVFRHRLKMERSLYFCCEEIGVCYGTIESFTRFLYQSSEPGDFFYGPWYDARKSLCELYKWLYRNSSNEELVVQSSSPKLSKFLKYLNDAKFPEIFLPKGLIDEYQNITLLEEGYLESLVSFYIFLKKLEYKVNDETLVRPDYCLGNFWGSLQPKKREEIFDEKFHLLMEGRSIQDNKIYRKSLEDLREKTYLMSVIMSLFDQGVDIEDRLDGAQYIIEKFGISDKSSEQVVEDPNYIMTMF